MNEHLTKDEFLAHFTPMREDIRELINQVRLQNGRLSSAETRIAVLETEDRKPGTSKGQAGWISAIVAGVISGLAAVFGK